MLWHWQRDNERGELIVAGTLHSSLVRADYRIAVKLMAMPARMSKLNS